MCIKILCQRVNAEHKKTPGLLQPSKIFDWKWEHLTMDLISGLPTTKKDNDNIRLLVDRLMKSAHFIPMKIKTPMGILAKCILKRVLGYMECQFLLF